MTEKVLAFAAENVQQGRKVAWITVTGTQGSSPASPGQVMAVAEGGRMAGTVGGGASEHHIAQMALSAMASGETIFSFDIDHGEDGMVCGGRMQGVGNVLGMEARCVIFGGGHIAQQLAPMAAATGFAVRVVEDRAALAEAFEGIDFCVSAPAAYPQDVPLREGDYVVICTRGHATDGDALRYALAQNPRYIGMIGSRKKVETLMRHLREEGVPEERLQRVYAPIGLAVATGRPAEIAVSILAEMLLVKNGGRPGHLRDRG